MVVYIKKIIEKPIRKGQIILQFKVKIHKQTHLKKFMMA